MIARIWRATLPRTRAQDYARHFTDYVAPSLSPIPGYRGARVLCNGESDPAEVVVVTWWSSREAIRGFAGPDIRRAVVAPGVRQMFVSCDDTVSHYEVIAEDEPRTDLS